MFVNSFKYSIFFGVLTTAFWLIVVYMTFIDGNTTNMIVVLTLAIIAISISVSIIVYYKNSIKEIIVDKQCVKFKLMYNKEILVRTCDIVEIIYCSNCIKIILENGKNYRVFPNNNIIKLNKIDQKVLKSDIFKDKTKDMRW